MQWITGRPKPGITSCSRVDEPGQIRVSFGKTEFWAAMLNAVQEERDKEWLEQIRRGDKRALEALFSAYYEALCNFTAQYGCRIEIAEELVQEIFLTLWRRRASWAPRGTVKGYLYRAARNQAFDHLRHRRTVAQWRDEVALRSHVFQASPEEDMEAKELTLAIEQAIDRLPESRRLIFTMNRHHGLSYAEIAAALDISPKTVENQMGRALKTLREFISYHALLFLFAF